MSRDLVKEYLSGGLPFAVCQYFEGFIFDEEARFKVYEFVYLKGDDIRTCVMSSESLRTFYSNFDKFEEKMNNVDGRIWEFKDFKANCPKKARSNILGRINVAENKLMNEQQSIKAQVANERMELELKLKLNR